MTSNATLSYGGHIERGLATTFFANLVGLPVYITWTSAALLLCTCIFTTTYTNQVRILRYVRLLLAVPTAVLWLAAGFPFETPPGQDVGAYTTPVTLGFLGFMKTLDVCVIGFWDTPQDIPRWQMIQRTTKKNGAAGDQVGKVTLPLPTSLPGRIAYAFDSLLTCRGASVFVGRVWDWAPSEIWTYKPPSTLVLLLERVKAILIGTFWLDVCEAIFATHRWDKHSPAPLTNSVYFPLQFIYTAVFGVELYYLLALSIHLLGIPLLLVPKKPTQCWAPINGGVTSATTLTGFWGKTWHGMLKRQFSRVTKPVEWILGPYCSKSTTRAARLFAVFGLSTILHLASPLGVPRDGLRHISPLEPGTIKFFFSQPVGIMIETSIVFPATERLPGRWKTVARTTFMYAWLLWTGRWYVDQYVKHGQFDKRRYESSPTTMLLERLGISSVL